MSWIVMIIALAGAYLNARKKASGFVLWMFSNGYWTYHNFMIGEYAQAVLFCAFLGLSVYGFYCWEK